MNTRLLRGALALSLLANVWLAASHHRPVGEARADVAPPTEELAIYMSHAQRHAHKLGLSIQAKNKPLAEFYLAELGETFELIQRKFPQYDGLQIAALSKAMLDPAKPALARSLAAGDFATASVAYDKYLAACNSCHVAAKHEYVKVVAPTGNPFNQSFATK
ncbi:MAG TPA: hypothetical protein VEC56_12630 [Candidatus Krumholzibacteria bacterium]|nr:hypothetical protein [Candidatus Krumholzibacteria bacterium]